MFPLNVTHRRSSVSQCRKPHRSIFPISSERGMTLIECLITLTLTSIIALWVTTFYRNFTIMLQAEKLQFLITQDLQLAKNLASTENRAISLCGTINGNQCVTAQTDHWPGWILFYDDNATFTPTAESMIHAVSPTELSPHFILKSTVNIGGGINIAPRREYAYGMGRSLPNGRLILCPQNTHISNPTQSSHQTHPEWIINVYGYFRITQEKGRC